MLTQVAVSSTNDLYCPGLEWLIELQEPYRSKIAHTTIFSPSRATRGFTSSNIPVEFRDKDKSYLSQNPQQLTTLWRIFLHVRYRESSRLELNIATTGGYMKNIARGAQKYSSEGERTNLQVELEPALAEESCFCGWTIRERCCQWYELFSSRRRTAVTMDWKRIPRCQVLTILSEQVRLSWVTAFTRHGHRSFLRNTRCTALSSVRREARVWFDSRDLAMDVR